ncbi:MAG: cysteine--tRNA ligase, partial [Candidatus Omnitrophica bacterium]|nr:cysteine--tRNA ligase [Candidatus Omnitrophota bacterium]
DDKIINKAKEGFKGENLNSAVKKVATKYLSAYHNALKELGINTESPDIIEPKASEYIDKMKEFIKILIEKKVAYQSGADVYFDITKAKKYGKLSNQSIDTMEVGARVAPTENKRNPLDFALWKSAKEDEPSWDSDWGKGRPGWHIECSVMSTDILGDEFDIHGGGLDLIFPHHENEIAQAEGAGKKFARFWIHHGLLTINGQKMAKSLGNFISVKDFLNKKYSADVLKLFFVQSHYAQPVDFTWEKMEEKKEALKSFEALFNRISQREKGGQYFSSPNIKNISVDELRDKIEESVDAFKTSMDDDFNTPNAVAVLFELRNACNNALYCQAFTKKYLPVLKHAEKTIKELGGVFGLSFVPEQLKSKEEKKEIERLKKKREELRKKKMFKEADQIREELIKMGEPLEDKKVIG